MKRRITRITIKDWTKIGKLNYAAKWCRWLCSYYLIKESDNNFKRVQLLSWPIYCLLFIPVHLLQAIVLLWDGGLREFTLLSRHLGTDVLSRGSEAFARAECIWTLLNLNISDINN